MMSEAHMVNPGYDAFLSDKQLRGWICNRFFLTGVTTMKATLFLMGCLVCVMTISAWGQDTEPLDIYGRVVDYKAQPVEKARIAVFENGLFGIICG